MMQTPVPSRAQAHQGHIPKPTKRLLPVMGGTKQGVEAGDVIAAWRALSQNLGGEVNLENRYSHG